jgi:hypothetical protein
MEGAPQRSVPWRRSGWSARGTELASKLRWYRTTGRDWSEDAAFTDCIVELGSRVLFSHWPRDEFSPWTFAGEDGTTEEVVAIRVQREAHGPWLEWAWNEGAVRTSAEGLERLAGKKPREIEAALRSLSPLVPFIQEVARSPRGRPRGRDVDVQQYHAAIRRLRRDRFRPTQRKVADELHVSIPTLRRWLREVGLSWPPAVE